MGRRLIALVVLPIVIVVALGVGLIALLTGSWRDREWIDWRDR